MAEHRPDVKAETPIETQHVTAECRGNRGQYAAWEDAVHRLLHVYEAQVFRRPGATVSLALYVTDPPDSTQPDTPAPGRSGERCICGTPGTGDFDGPRRDCPVHGEPPAPTRPTDVYCFCPDCIRCGCGMWERHHADVSAIAPVPRRSSALAIYDALQYHRSDSGLPVDGEERKP